MVRGSAYSVVNQCETYSYQYITINYFLRIGQLKSFNMQVYLNQTKLDETVHYHF